MSFPEILSLVLLAIIAGQIAFLRWILKSTLETMKLSHENAKSAIAISMRLLDGAGIDFPRQEHEDAAR